MGRIMISAMNSGSGKTLVTMAVLAVLRRRGRDCISMKCGPDYIDPMFHSRLLGVPCRNLDLFLMGAVQVLREVAAAESRGQVVIEGAMGYYDGIGGTDEASAYRIARSTGTPVILVVTPKGESLSLAAKIRGMQTLREGAGIAGVILNRCSRRLYDHLKPIIERENEIPVLGFLPDMPTAAIESRHLGLVTAGEIRDLEDKIRLAADAAEAGIDFDLLEQIASGAPALAFDGGGKNECPEEAFFDKQIAADATAARSPRCRIAVARDEAFSFYYESGFEALQRAGAELAFFSPLRDTALPSETDALYLGGGYPELYAHELSKNEAMRAAIRTHLKAGLPLLAECGGFLYLGNTLEAEAREKGVSEDSLERTAAGGGDKNTAIGGKPASEEKQSVDMVGFFPGHAHREKRLVRFGYACLTSEADSMLVRRGERVPCHEFHYYESTENGAGLISAKPDGTRAVSCGFVNDHMYAAFPHLSLAGEIPLAERFVEAAVKYRKDRNKD